MHVIWDKLEQKERATLISVFVASIVLAWLLGYGWGRSAVQSPLHTAGIQGGAVEVIDLSKPEPATETNSAKPEPAEPTEPPPPSELAVHVAGAVKKSGVYHLPPNSRVDDAIRQAGGATANADLDALNLAELVSDGQKIYVPRKGETPPLAVSASASTTNASRASRTEKAAPTTRFPIDLNTATAEQLEAIPGIGPTLAQRIVDYRRANGRFHSVEELLEVQGIGQKRLENMRPYVIVK
ncbi:MAG: helix-hairpin-helix domain-containing protein [Fimbriimonadales bacterium]|nr:helix-hairpin-helix domain-containing protein [Fimbriimonadales bacterium]